MKFTLITPSRIIQVLKARAGHVQIERLFRRAQNLLVSVGWVNVKIEQSKAGSLAVRVQSEGSRDAFAGWTAQDEVEGAQARDAEALDRARGQRGEQIRESAAENGGKHAGNGQRSPQCHDRVGLHFLSVRLCGV